MSLGTGNTENNTHIDWTIKNMRKRITGKVVVIKNSLCLYSMSSFTSEFMSICKRHNKLFVKTFHRFEE